MSNRVVKTKILQRIDTESNWEKVNPILLTGEIAFVQTENNGVLMKVGDGSNYKDIPFQTNIKIDKIPATCFNVEHISQDEYYNLVVNEEIDINTLYVISSDNLNLYGEQIKNVAEPTDENDAVNKKYVDELSVNLKNDIKIPKKTSELTNDSDFTTTTELDKVKTATINLSNELKTKSSVVIDGVKSDLSVVHISQDDYHALVKDNNVLSNIIYVVSSDEMNMYNERIINVADAIGGNDAVNLNQLCSAISSIDIPEIPQNISEFENDSQYAKISVDGNSTTEFNVEHISQDDYHDLVVNGKIDGNRLYIVSSDAINAYGEKITNLADGSLANDAATYGQLSNLQHIHETTITDIQVIKPEFKHSNVHISLSVFEDSKLNDFVINVDSALSSQYFLGYHNDGETQSWESNPTGFGVEYDNRPVLISLTDVLKDNGLENKYSKLFLLYEWYYSDGSSHHTYDRYSVAVPSYTEVGANASDYVTKTQHDELQMEILKPSYGTVKTDDMFVCQSNKTNNIADILNGTVQILLEDFSFEKQYDIKFTTGDEDVTFEFNINDPINGPEYDENWNINKNYKFEPNNTYLIKIRQDFIEVVENSYLKDIKAYVDEALSAAIYGAVNTVYTYTEEEINS